MSRTLANMLGVLGAGMVGYQKGVDQATERERRARDDEYQQEQRERTRREQGRQDRIRATMAETYAPTTVQTEPTKPDTMDDRDVGQPGEPAVGGYMAGGRMVDGLREGGQRFATRPEAEAFAANYNTPHARTLRMADVLGGEGEVQAAQALRTAARQEQIGAMQFDETQRTFAKNRFREQAMQLAGDPQALAGLVSGSELGGPLNVQAERSQDGKTFAFVKVLPDGSKAPASTSYPNTRDGYIQAVADLSDAIPLEQQIRFMHQRAQLDEQTRHNKAVEGIAQSKAAATAPAAAPLWDDKSDAFLKQRYTVKDEMTGVTSVDGAGMEFAKTVALGHARENGGDTTIALGRAFDADNRLKAVAKGDGAKLRELRQQYLNAVNGAAGSGDVSSGGRPMTNMEAVAADMRKSGLKEARISLSAPDAPFVPPAKDQAASTAPAAGGVAVVPTPLANARARRTAAEAAVMQFGSRQRQQNPNGFRAAQAELAAAQAAEDEISQKEAASSDAEYDKRAERALNAGPGFRYPKP